MIAASFFVFAVFCVVWQFVRATVWKAKAHDDAYKAILQNELKNQKIDTQKNDADAKTN